MLLRVKVMKATDAREEDRCHEKARSVDVDVDERRCVVMFLTALFEWSGAELRLLSEAGRAWPQLGNDWLFFQDMQEACSSAMFAR